MVDLYIFVVQVCQIYFQILFIGRYRVMDVLLMLDIGMSRNEFVCEGFIFKFSIGGGGQIRFFEVFFIFAELD